MSNTRTLLRCAATAAVVLILAFATWASAADILDDWANVKPPPPPELKAVTLDGATTAILIMDMNQIQCAKNPRCAASTTAIKRIHDLGRPAGAMFWYSIPGDNAKPSDMEAVGVGKGYIPLDGEWEPINGPDKFRGSNLEDKLKARGIKTAIICGHSFQGVGIGTGSALASARLSGDHTDRLHVLQRPVRDLPRTVCSVAHVQERQRRSKSRHTDAQLHDYIREIALLPNPKAGGTPKFSPLPLSQAARRLPPLSPR